MGLRGTASRISLHRSICTALLLCSIDGVPVVWLEWAAKPNSANRKCSTRPARPSFPEMFGRMADIATLPSTPTPCNVNVDDPPSEIHLGRISFEVGFFAVPNLNCLIHMNGRG